MPCEAPLGRRRRLTLPALFGLIVGLSLLALRTSPALAAGEGVGLSEITCTHVTFTYEGFAPAEGNTVAETITVNKAEYASDTFVFNGSTGSNTIAILGYPGKFSVDAHAVWNTNGVHGSFDHHANLKCKDGFEIEKLQTIAGSGEPFTKSPLTGKAGQRLDYEIIVKNTGGVPLSFGALEDPKCEAGTLAGGPGEVPVEAGESTTFTCEQSMPAVGAYTNTATITGTPLAAESMGKEMKRPPEGDEPITHTSNTVIATVPPEPGYTIEKLQSIEGSEAGYTKAPLEAGVGSTILYRIVIDNTGNVPLDFAEFTDPHCDPGTLIGGPGAEPLQPGESSVYTCDHLLVAKNLKKGLPYENTATIKATPPPGDGGTISETSNTVVVYLLGGGGTTEFSCTGVTFSYTGFPNAENNTITQEIRINQELVSVTTFMFNGPSGSDTVPIEVPAGKSIVDAHAIWKTNGSGGGFDHHAKVKCTAPEEKNGNS